MSQQQEPRPRIGVVTDAAAGLPRTVVRAWEQRGDFRCVPMPVQIGDQIHPDDTDPEVLSELAVAAAEGRGMTTSRPSPAVFDRAYRELFEAGCEQILSVHLSGELSGTVAAAQSAAERAEGTVRVIDTRTVALAEGFAAAAALGRSRKGASAEEVEQAAVQVCEEARLLFHVPSLEYLARGGRIPWALGRVGQLLRIQPIATVQEGRLTYLERPRQAAQARARLLEMVLEDVQDCLDSAETTGTDRRCVLGLHDFFSDGLARELREAVRDRFGGAVQVLESDLPAVLGVHSGLGPVCAVVVPRGPVGELLEDD